MCSMQQLVKYIRLAWHSNVETNAVVSALLSRLGVCYTFAMTEQHFHCWKMGFVCHCFVNEDSQSFKQHGLVGRGFICETIEHHQTHGNDVGFGRNHYPIVFNYLLMLLDTTTVLKWDQDQPVQDNYTKTEAKAIHQKHQGAQKYILWILNNLKEVDQLVLKEYQHRWFSFLLHQAKWEQEEVEGDTLGLVLGTRTFEYIVDNVGTFATLEDQVSLLNKMKEASTNMASCCNDSAIHGQRLERTVMQLLQSGADNCTHVV